MPGPVLPMPLRFMCVDQKPAIRCNEISTVRAYKTGRTQFVIYLASSQSPGCRHSNKITRECLMLSYFDFGERLMTGWCHFICVPTGGADLTTPTRPLYLSHTKPLHQCWSKFNSRFMIFLLLFYSDRVVHLASVVVSVENKSRLVCWVTGKRSRVAKWNQI
jgi:hypothetical protein